MQELTSRQVVEVAGGFFVADNHNNHSSGSSSNSSNSSDYTEGQVEYFFWTAMNALKNPIGLLFFSTPVGQGSDRPLEEGEGQDKESNPDTTLPGGGGAGLPKP